MTAALTDGTRHDGWTPDRQVRFLTAIAEGQLVQQACALVGLSVTAAYSFRRRAGEESWYYTFP